MVTFKNTIIINATVHLKATSIKIEAEMKETLNAYAINHTVEHQETLTNIRQRTYTDLFVDLQSE